MQTAPGEVSTATAAALLQISPRRLRQLADEGRIVIHRRGYTTLSSAVRGYIRFLKDSGQTETASAAAARSHSAKAGLIRAHTERRRATLTPRAEAEGALQAVAATAVARLRAVDVPGLDPATARALATEIEAAITRIGAAAASTALATGDLAELDKAGHA